LSILTQRRVSEGRTGSACITKEKAWSANLFVWLC
jgi:hypothetical protein